VVFPKLLARDVPDVQANADEGSVRLAEPSETTSDEEARP
jgi:hypothetical protein